MGKNSGGKLNTSLAVLVLVLAAVIGIMVFLGTQVKPEVVQGSAPFNESAVRSFKISSLTYRYTNIIYREGVQKLGDFNIPFTKTYLGVRYDGTMDIGIDAEQMTVTYSGEDVTITLPPTKILSHSLVHGTMEVLFDVDTPFARNSVSDYNQLFDSEQQAMEQRAIEAGMLDTAAANAKQQMQDFVASLPGMENYTVTVKSAAAS